MSTNFEDEERLFSEWVSQAEAARLHGVSRQAINKLVQSGRLRSKEIGGHILVSRSDLESFKPLQAGRGKTENPKSIERVKKIISSWKPEHRLELFKHLRGEFPIHPLESELGATAEVILDSISRAGEFTVRMIRGVLAEAAFEYYVVRRLNDWQIQPIQGSHPYDLVLIRGAEDPVRVQVKLQRSEKGQPLLAKERSRKYRFMSGMYIAEPHRTRGGKKRQSEEETRPYRFGDFDILAVCMFPSSRSWESFRYTVANWLIPRPEDSHLIEKYQPIPPKPNEDWTDDFEVCVQWLRSGVVKTIGGRRV